MLARELEPGVTAVESARWTLRRLRPAGGRHGGARNVIQRQRDDDNDGYVGFWVQNGQQVFTGSQPSAIDRWKGDAAGLAVELLYGTILSEQLLSLCAGSCV